LSVLIINILLFLLLWLRSGLRHVHHLALDPLLPASEELDEVFNFSSAVRARLLHLSELDQAVMAIAIVAAWSNDVRNVLDLHAHLALAGAGCLPVQHRCLQLIPASGIALVEIF